MKYWKSRVLAVGITFQQAATLARCDDSRKTEQQALILEDINQVLRLESETDYDFPAAPTITKAPTFHPKYLHRRQEGLSACVEFSTYLNCDAPFVTPYALCACYTSGTFAGSYVDGLASRCSVHISSVRGASSATPFNSFTSFCRSVGDVSSILSSEVSSCSSVNSRDRVCASSSASIDLYGILGASAACACYIGTTFRADRNDDWASTCWSRASLLDLPFTATISDYTDLCERAGDVVASATTSATAGDPNLRQRCSSVNDIITKCQNAFSGFLQRSATERASCLCYSSTFWIPREVDGAVSDCLSAASVTNPAGVTSLVYNSIEGLCGSVGNVRNLAQTTSADPGGTSSVNDPTGIPDDEGGGLSGGALAGAIVGAIAGTAALVGLGLFVFFRRRRNPDAPAPPGPTSPAGYGGLEGPEIGGISENKPVESFRVPAPPAVVPLPQQYPYGQSPISPHTMPQAALHAQQQQTWVTQQPVGNQQFGHFQQQQYQQPHQPPSSYPYPSSSG